MLLPLALALLASVTSAYQLPAARGANSCAAGAARSGLAVRMDATEDRIKELIDENKIMLFMKGNKMFPQCGFSNTAVMSKRSLINDRTRLSLAFLIRLPWVRGPAPWLLGDRIRLAGNAADANVSLRAILVCGAADANTCDC